MIRGYILLVALACIFLIPVNADAESMEQNRLELDYGTSYHLAVFGQTLNPDAEKNLEPVDGLDGQAAVKILDKYRKSFEKTKEEPAYILSIGQSKK